MYRKTKTTEHITEIRLENGNTTTDLSKSNDILNNFHEKLYTSDFPNDRTPLADLLSDLKTPLMLPDNLANERGKP